MCGIVGIFQTRSRDEVSPKLLADMNDSQIHRGPDDEGFHIEPGVGLGHRRLSIIDISAGQQPIYNEDRSIVVIYNGEIYNYRELTQELIRQGHEFRTHCDTEVIVHAWEQWGEACVRQFRGMFAFALWDSNRRLLFLARDRLGIKPLYYASLADGQVIFASELKALLMHPGLNRELDPRAVEDYFAYGYVPDPKTILRDVYKLPPCHTLTIGKGAAIPSPKKYWDVPFGPSLRLSEQEAIEELNARLRQAVKIRMVSEVPLGAFLSGGIDSSSVVAMMANASSDPVNTCSIAFDDPKFNEVKFAEKVANLYKTRHYVKQVQVDDFDLLDKLTTVYDEPFADDSALATYRLCELARKRVTVALSGDGGDESFAGYEWYFTHVQKQRVRSLLPGFVRQRLFGVLGHIYPNFRRVPRFLRAKTTLETLALDPIESFSRSIMISTDSFRRQLFSANFIRDMQGYRALEVLREHARNAPTDHPLSLVQYLDMKVYLPSDILTKVDRASMAHSLEVRVPLLDHECVEWLSCLPPDFKLRGRTQKYIFKKALERTLPREILHRKKMGFDVPVAQWFRGPLRERLRPALLSSNLMQDGIFNRKFVERLIDEHGSGSRNYGTILWSLLVFESFHRHYLQS